MATIRRRGKCWHAQVRRVGSSSQTKSFLSKVEALEWGRAVEGSIDRGVNPSPSPIKALRGIRFKSLLERYLREVTPSKRGATEEAYRIGRLIADPMAELMLSEVNQFILVAYRDQRLKFVGPATVKREFVIIKHCMEVARHSWGLPIQSNPAANISIAGINPGRTRTLLVGEEELLMLKAAKLKNALVLPIIKFAIATGMRRGEILGMRWGDLQMATRGLLIPTTKSGQARTIPLSKGALRVLEGLSPTHDLVFPMSPNACRLAWERLTRRAGIKDLHFHDLRHEALSRFFELGLSSPEVALISGHSDIRMLFRYTHPTRQRILDKLDSF